MNLPVKQTPITTTLQRAYALMDKGHLKDASLLARDLLKFAPADSRSWQLMSSVHFRAGRLDEAATCLERSVLCAPSDPVQLIRYGQCLARLGRRREALAVAERVASMPLAHPALSDGLGTIFSFCDEPARALRLFTHALAAVPDNSAFRYNLATAQRMVGDLTAAEINLDQVIATNPSDYAAYYTRSDLRTQTAAANHIDEMARLLGDGVANRSAELTLCFALAKELEDVGDHARSFEHLKRGCDLQRSSMSYDVEADVETIDRIIQLHNESALTGAHRRFDNTECIFIIGLPRSGTTLVEMIIAAHSAVHPAGELQAFSNQAVQMVKELTGTAVSKLEFVERSLEIDPRELGHRYIAETRPQTGHTPRFIDKMPLNYLYAGLIRRALPRARIIALARDPMDVCYAMYKTLFTAAYPFSYDLNDLGRYYLAWHRLMRHWQTVLGDALLVVQYEDLVANQEAVSRRIVHHCGLEWQDACLTFHQQQRSVASASAVQVRRPIYASSIGKWRHYAGELAVLSHQLAGL